MCDSIQNPFEYDRGMKQLEEDISVLGRLLAEKDEKIRQLELRLSDTVHIAGRS